MARVLIGCETSGVVRRAFAALGHDAWSCDLLPADDGSNHHIRGDIRDHLNDGWDLLAVMHPPCTRLCNSGVSWLIGADGGPPKKLPKSAPGEATKAEKATWAEKSFDEKLKIMWRLLDEGAALFTACWQAPIPRVAVENPIMHKYARERLPADLVKPQIVQPWWFGEQAKKATGLYLRGLPPLQPTNKLTPPPTHSDENKRWQAVHYASPGPERWKLRSKTFQGIADAMASQWGGPIEDQMELFA